VVVVEIEGVVKEVPVPKEEPPDDAAYQLSVPPAHPEALNATVPVPQVEPPVPVGAVGGVVTVASAAVVVLVHPLIVQVA
jgi:hypothetical protein